CLRAPRRDGLAPFLALRLQLQAPRIQRAELIEPAIQLATGARERLLRHADLARRFSGLLFESFATKRGLLGPRSHRFELRKQVRVLAVRALDAGLRGVALGLG